MNFGNDNILRPIGANTLLDMAAKTPQQSYVFGVNTLGQVGKFVSGGRKRRSASPKRRVARATVLPKRHVARPAMRRMFN